MQLCAVGFLVVAGCTTPRPHAVSISNTAKADPPPPCGFTSFTKLDDAAWDVARTFKTNLLRYVGTCRLEEVDPQNQDYSLRQGSVEIAQITRYGMLLLVP